MRAYVFPGQGAQTIGMGRALAEAVPAARAVFEEVDEALGERLSALIWEGDAETLTLTANAQAASYVELAVGDRVLWGAGMDTNTTRASLKAVISAVNRAVRDTQEQDQD